MGLFGKKSNSGTAVLMATHVTLGQAIYAVEQANNLKVGEAWDIFINSVGILTDVGIFEEFDALSITSMGKFPEDHELTLDLLKIRANESKVRNFIDSNKRVLEIVYSNRNIDGRIDWEPKEFADQLAKMAQATFPNFGSTNKDQAFYAIIGLYMMTLITDTQSDSNTNKTFRRLTGYEFALRWLGQWNVAKKN